VISTLEGQIQTRFGDINTRVDDLITKLETLRMDTTHELRKKRSTSWR